MANEPDRTPDHIPLTTYIDLVNESSSRARWSLIVLVVASVVVFSGYWNGRAASWYYEHVEVREKSLKWVTENLDKKGNLTHPDNDISPFMAMNGYTNNKESKKRLEDTLSDLRKDGYENIHRLRVPVFGIVIDVNDLGMFGGFAFVVVLMLFRFNLAREHDNLRRAFSVAQERGKLAEVFDVLMMAQVFTVPPTRRHGEHSLWNYARVVLLLPPMLIQLLVFMNDWDTYDYGYTVSKWNTRVTSLSSVAFFVMIVLLTISCLMISRSTTLVWDTKAKALRPKTHVTGDETPASKEIQ